MKRTIVSGLLLLAGCAGICAAADPEAEVLKAEEEFRLAKLNADVTALQQILADDYYGTNQYGASRDKAALMDLFRQGFRLSSLKQPKPEARIAGDLAIVTGSMTEVNPGGEEKLRFVRVYVKRAGRWQLLSSAQLIPVNP
jgi:ketosteroid isomerase-like protein